MSSDMLTGCGVAGVAKSRAAVELVAVYDRMLRENVQHQLVFAVDKRDRDNFWFTIPYEPDNTF